MKKDGDFSICPLWFDDFCGVSPKFGADPLQICVRFLSV